MTTCEIHDVAHAIECSSNPVEERVVVEFGPFNHARKTATDCLRIFRDLDFEIEAIRNIMRCFDPIVTLSHLPTHWDDDRFGFGEQFLQNVNTSINTAKIYKEDLVHALRAYQSSAQLLISTEHSNPLRSAVAERIENFLLHSNGTYIAIPIRERHVDIWNSLLHEYGIDRVNVRLKLPAALKNEATAALCTIGPMHPWNKSRLGWPSYFRTAPIAPYLLNVRWSGEQDRKPHELVNKETVQWTINESLRNCTPADFHSGDHIFSRIEFEDLYAPGKNDPKQRCHSHPPTQSGRDFHFRVTYTNGQEKVFDPDREGQTLYLVKANASVYESAYQITSELNPQLITDDIVLAVIRDGEARRDNVTMYRGSAPPDIIQMRNLWKQQLKNILSTTSKRKDFVQKLRSMPGCSTVLSSYNNLKNWADTKLEAIHGPDDFSDFHLLCEALGRSKEQIHEAWNAIEYLRGIGHQAGRDLSKVIIDSIRPSFESLSAEDWDLINIGRTATINFNTGSAGTVNIDICRIDSIVTCDTVETAS